MVNLLSQEQRTHVMKETSSRFLGFLLGVIGVCCLLGVAVLLPFIMTARSRIATFELESDRIAAALERIRVSPEDAQVREYVYLLEQADTVQRVREHSRIIEDISATRPLGVLVYSIALDQDPIVSLHGVSESRGALVEFSSALRKLPRVAHVDVPITNFIEGIDLSYSITLELHEE